MGSSSGDSDIDDGPIVGINVTPLVDVVLVLLVVLMVSAPLLSSKVLPIDLPKAGTGSEQQVVLSIELSADGRTVVNQVPVGSDEDMLRVVRSAHEKSKDVRAVIDADGMVPHHRVVRVMDILRAEQIGKVAFGVRALNTGDSAR